MICLQLIASHSITIFYIFFFSLSLSLSLTGEEGVSVRERERKRERECCMHAQADSAGVLHRYRYYLYDIALPALWRALSVQAESVGLL